MDDDTLPPENDSPEEDQNNLNNPDEQDRDQSQSSHSSPKKTYDQLKDLKNLRGTPKPPIGTPSPAAGAGSAAAGEGATAGTGAAATSAGTAAGSTGAAASGAAAGGAAAGGTAATGAAAGASGAAASGAAASGATAGGGGIIAFFSTPPGWVVLALIILFLLILFLYLALQNQQNGEVTVTLTKTAPAEVKNDENIPYKLNVSYTGNPSQIIVTDPLPENTEFVSAGQNAQTLDASGKPTTDPTKVKTVKWTLSGSGGNSASGSGTATGDNSPPNKDTCGGIYDSINQGGQHNGDNFGDPSCTLANSKRTTYDFKGHHWDGVPQGLIDLLQQLDPDNVGYWIGISSCEAPGFDPNNVSVAVNGSAYGLFQMGSSYSGGKETPYGTSDGLNGKYDRGDVNWQNQISNAVNYNKQVGGNWTYWACARDVWGLW